MHQDNSIFFLIIGMIFAIMTVVFVGYIETAQVREREREWINNKTLECYHKCTSMLKYEKKSIIDQYCTNCCIKLANKYKNTGRVWWDSCLMP